MSIGRGAVSEGFSEQLGELPTGFGVGSRMGGYRLERQIGAGGMAVMFGARDEGLARIVALKVLTPALVADGAFRQRWS